MKKLSGGSMEPYGWKESCWLSKGICGDGGYEWQSTPWHIGEDTTLPQSPKQPGRSIHAVISQNGHSQLIQ